VFTRIATASAVIAFFVAVVVTVASLQERDAPQAGALAGRSPAPTPTQAATAVNTPQAGVLTRSAGSRPGYERITSVEGGWSFEIPSTWTAVSAPMRGADIASFDLRVAKLSGNAPAADELRIRVQLATDYDATPLETFGARDVPSWLVVAQTHTVVSGSDAVRTVRNAYVPVGSPFDEQHVVWDFRSPFLADRIVAVDAWPANGTQVAEAERAMATFELFAPPPVITAPKISRVDATARAVQYAAAFGAAGSSTAKLVFYRDYDRAQIAEAKRIGGPYGVGGADPDALVWVVVVRGDFQMPRGGGPPGIGASPLPPPKLVWLALIVNGLDGTVGNYAPGLSGDRPAWFDGLADRGP
jgi:hypothetical protein